MIQTEVPSNERRTHAPDGRLETSSDREGVRAIAHGNKARLERYALFRVAESVVRGFTKDRVTNTADRAN
jgi:hypothetical protein